MTEIESSTPSDSNSSLGTSSSGTTTSSSNGSDPRTGSRKPKSPTKNQRSWRETLSLGPIARPLPTYAGPYSVGVMEIEVPVESPRSFCNESEHYRGLLELETVLMCIYYPSAIGSGIGDDASGKKGWSRQTWLPRPRRMMADGYSKFAGLPDWVGELWFAATTMPTKLPAYRNAPLAEHWAPDTTVREGGIKIKHECGSPPPDFKEDEKPIFPLIMFSHGLGGTRTTYSQVCGEFASFGFVVCAVEHRDGSSPRTFVLRENQPKDSDTSDSDHEKKYSPRIVDYIMPKDNPYDTAPSNDKGVDFQLRDGQLEMRKAEISEAFKVMTAIENGDGELISKKNLRKKGNIGSSSRGLNGVDWSRWKGRFHLKQVTMVGHSFGGATTVEILRDREKNYPYITQGIIYDVWGAPLRPPSPTSEARIKCPLLAINSEAFMYWEDNFKKAMSLVKEAAGHEVVANSNGNATPKNSKQSYPAYLMTVRGTVHLSQSDFPILYPHIVSAFFHTTIPPKLAIEINIRASLEFLRRVLPERISAVERASRTVGLLDVDMLDDVPMSGKPKHPKHLAVRIRRPSLVRELFSGKLTPTVVYQKYKQRKSLDFSSDDIWMHFTPNRRYQKKKHISDETEPYEASDNMSSSSSSNDEGRNSDETLTSSFTTHTTESNPGHHHHFHLGQHNPCDAGVHSAGGLCHLEHGGNA